MEMTWKQLIKVKCYRMSYALELSIIGYLLSGAFIQSLLLDLMSMKDVISQRSFLGFMDIACVCAAVSVLVYELIR
jgi:hypothetical protein